MTDGLVERPRGSAGGRSSYSNVRYLRRPQGSGLPTGFGEESAAKSNYSSRQSGKTLGQQKMTVTVYSTGPQCQKCNLTKRHLTRRGIAFEEVVVDPNNPNDMNYAALAYMGYLTAPVVLVSAPDGEQDWVDYHPDRIDALAK